MPLIVGNLLTVPSAQSFISLADAVAYLEPEAADAGENTPLGRWITLDSASQEATLVRASRWLAGSYSWYTLSETCLVRVGHVAARLAAETVGRGIYSGTDTASVVASESVGSISVTYRGGMKADLAGLSLPWLKPALAGLIHSGNVSWLARA